MSTELLQTIAKWLAITSLATFFLSLIIIPLIINRLPGHCFIEIPLTARRKELTASRVILLLVRNAVGALLLVAGIAMLFLPGQGLLTILMGILFLSFPGKRKIIIFLIHKPVVQRSLDWIRRKSGAQTFTWPEKSDYME